MMPGSRKENARRAFSFHLLGVDSRSLLRNKLMTSGASFGLIPRSPAAESFIAQGRIRNFAALHMRPDTAFSGHKNEECPGTLLHLGYYEKIYQFVSSKILNVCLI